MLSNSSGPSISPGCGSATGVPSGAISPGAQSQTSNAAAAPMQSCCENGRPIITDPVSGQTVCSCQYDSARLALSGYSRIPAAGVSVYGAPYPSTDQNPYPSIGVDSSAFYSPLVSWLAICIPCLSCAERFLLPISHTPHTQQNHLTNCFSFEILPRSVYRLPFIKYFLPEISQIYTYCVSAQFFD